MLHRGTLQHPRTAKAPRTRPSSASLQLEHPPRVLPCLPRSLSAPLPPALAGKLPKPHPVHLWPGKRAPLTLNPGPGRVSGDMAQLADVPAEDKRTKASSFHSDRHEFKEAKRLRQDQQMLPDRRNLLPLSGARDVFCVLSRHGSGVVTGIGTSGLRQGSFSPQ